MDDRLVQLSKTIAPATPPTQLFHGTIARFLRQMHHDGYLLYPTPGNVWLTATVPPGYITHAPTR